MIQLLLIKIPLAFFFPALHLLQELSKIAMPVIFNEPLSFLQRLSEYMEHTQLIHRANATPDSMERMKVGGGGGGGGACPVQGHVLITQQPSSVLQPLLCPLWRPSGRELGNHSTPYWERPLSSSGKGSEHGGAALHPGVNLVPCCREDLGFRWVSEQVSHHPPVSAFQAQGLEEDFVFHGSIYPKLKFWGKSIEAEPRGVITLELPK